MEKISKGSVLEEQFVTTVCNPYLAPPSNHWLPEQTRPLGPGLLRALHAARGLPTPAALLVAQKAWQARRATLFVVLLCQVCNLVFVVMASHLAAAGQTVLQPSVSLSSTSSAMVCTDRQSLLQVLLPWMCVFYVFCSLFLFYCWSFTSFWAQHSGFLWDRGGVTIKPTYRRGEMLKSRNTVSYPHSSSSTQSTHQDNWWQTPNPLHWFHTWKKMGCV